MKKFRFRVAIKSGVASVEDYRTVPACNVQMAEMILKSSLAVVYGPTNFEIRGQGVEV